jgi:hypothetical protein
VFLEPRLVFAVFGNYFIHFVPEGVLMIRIGNMSELMDNDIISFRPETPVARDSDCVKQVIVGGIQILKGPLHQPDYYQVVITPLLKRTSPVKSRFMHKIAPKPIWQ